MATGSKIFLVSLVILLGQAMAQLDDVGTFTMTSKEGATVDVHCHAYAGNTICLFPI